MRVCDASECDTLCVSTFIVLGPESVCEVDARMPFVLNDTNALHMDAKMMRRCGHAM